MLLKTTVLCCCLLACSLVSAQADEKNVPALDAKPTEAPLMRSTVKPTMAPMVMTQPTKAMIFNVPPKKPTADKMMLMETVDSMSDAMAKQLNASPAMVKTDTLKTGIRVSDTKPVQVTGFITKEGNIYEIEDKNGIGMIEGRQNPSNENMNVCNYGSIVIYSDVPCEQVTNVRVGEAVQTTLKDEKEQNNANNQNTQETNQNSDTMHNKDKNNNTSLDQELEDLDDDVFDKPAPVRQPNKNRRRVQQNQNKKRKSNKNKKKSSPIKSNQVNRRRSQAQKNRKRKNQQQNSRRRLQNQNQQNGENRIRPNQQNRTRKGNGNGNSIRNGSNGSRRGNDSSNLKGSNKRRQNQSKKRQHETTDDRRRYDEDDF